MNCQTIRFIGDLKTVYEDGWTTVYWCDGRISEIIGRIKIKKYMEDADWYYHSEPKPTNKMHRDGWALTQYLMSCYHNESTPTKEGFEKYKLMEVLK